MSHQLGRLISQILHRYFGDLVQNVGYDLFTYGSKPIVMITKSTGLTRLQVIECLRTLLKFDLAVFEATGVAITYKLVPDNVLLLIRYPRYLLQIKSKYGSEAELIVEELLQKANSTATQLLVTIANKYKDDKEKNINIVQLKDTFISLATAGYIQQSPVAEIKEGSEIPTLVPVATIVPDLDARVLMQAMANPADVKDTGEIMCLLLKQMYLVSAAWAEESTPTAVTDIREHAKRLTDRPLLMQHLDHYLKYAVRGAGAAERLLCDVIEHLVTERLGSNAARTRVNKCVL
ncbi:unnamed protein product [Leptidea sinapis]|uniref:DNA-directed RNA polymerase III subunit RPC3 n=1 Tax=Leptidea sinapis TaxID=189913 RepID=A0A5E4QYZ6_9NEOP|nr:unnamed protein product [Leptidea sinapis]